MAHMTLPAAHTEADALLAERIGRTLGLEEVHVFWTLPLDGSAASPRGESEPAGGADPDDGAEAPTGLIGALFALGDMGIRLGARLLSRGR